MRRREKQRRAVRANQAQRQRDLNQELDTQHPQHAPITHSSPDENEQMNHWEAVIAQYKQSGPCKADRVEGTQDALDREWGFWER
jgi:hypothetical protein